MKKKYHKSLVLIVEDTQPWIMGIVYLRFKGRRYYEPVVMSNAIMFHGLKTALRKVGKSI